MGRLEGRDRLHVIHLLGLAHLGHAHRRLGQRGLKREDGRSVGLRLLGGASGQRQHVGDVRLILLPQLDILGPGAQVVILLRQPQAALPDGCNLLAGVLEVLLLAVAEEDFHVHPLQSANDGGQLRLATVAVAHAVDLVQQRLDRGQPLLLDQVGIHAGGIVVADLLLVRRALGSARRGLGHDAIQRLRVDVGQRVELVHTRLIRWNRMVRRKLSAGKFIEIITRIHALIERRRVKAWNRHTRRRGHCSHRLLLCERSPPARVIATHIRPVVTAVGATPARRAEKLFKISVIIHFSFNSEIHRPSISIQIQFAFKLEYSVTSFLWLWCK
jgi:hypothetical protein